MDARFVNLIHSWPRSENSLVVGRGSFDLETPSPNICDSLQMPSHTFRGKSGRLRREEYFLEGFVRTVGPGIRLPNSWLLAARETFDDHVVERPPFRWKDYLLPEATAKPPLHRLPIIGARIPISSKSERFEILKELVLQFQYQKFKDDQRQSVLYVVPTSKVKEDFIINMGPHVVGKSFRYTYDDEQVGIMEPYKANNYGVMPRHFAVIFHDQSLLTTPVGYRYWCNALENDTPFFTFYPKLRLSPKDQEMVDMILGPSLEDFQ